MLEILCGPHLADQLVCDQLLYYEDYKKTINNLYKKKKIWKKIYKKKKMA